ncbi:MAG: nucleotide pyrophosphohydrolase [Betaproteobacteria bacterium]|nr:MAG: nucleotide pyrophosphohydrolase [Betaproteobacteria bacterium]
MDSEDSLSKLRVALAEFVEERDWDQFHNPKNLAMALAAEAGELLEHFQWLSEADAGSLGATQRHEVAMEMADILMFLLRLADRLQVDLLKAADEKLELNRRRYPVEKARGRATKYDKL